jgi:hypothetical protein
VDFGALQFLHVHDAPPGDEGDQRVAGHGGPEHLLQDRLRDLLPALGLGAVTAGHQLERVAEPAQLMGCGSGKAGAENDVLGIVHRQRCCRAQCVRQPQPAEVGHGACVGGLGPRPGVVHGITGFNDGAGDSAGSEVQGEEQAAWSPSGDQDLHLPLDVFR